MFDTDLLIIGGGPAGTAAAISAARAGWRVTILERELFPRDRPGETLHPGIEPLLESLGAGKEILSAQYLRHTGIWRQWQEEEAHFQPFGSDQNGDWRGFQAIRADFDARLLDIAIKSGAEVHQGIIAKELLKTANRVCGIKTTTDSISACFTIDATGDRQFLAHQNNIKYIKYSQPLIAHYGYVQGDYPNCNDAPWLRSDRTGWQWIARIAPSTYQWTKLSVKPEKLSPHWRPAELNELTPIGRTRARNVTWRIAEQTAGPGFFLVGDAACLLDPSSSHGVLRALMTGMMASHLINLLANNSTPQIDYSQSYNTWLREWFLHDIERLTAAYQKIGLSI